MTNYPTKVFLRGYEYDVKEWRGSFNVGDKVYFDCEARIAYDENSFHDEMNRAFKDFSEEKIKSYEESYNKEGIEAFEAMVLDPHGVFYVFELEPTGNDLINKLIYDYWKGELKEMPFKERLMRMENEDLVNWISDIINRVSEAMRFATADYRQKNNEPWE